MKINIIGTSGSGKSTFGRRIAEALAIPYIEMDRLYWRANWQGTPDDEFLATLEKALAASPDWVLDGNYNRTRDVKWRDVDLVVWIDRGFIRTLW
ncbi:adenylate kinase, partial [Enterobacter hormaechei]